MQIPSTLLTRGEDLLQAQLLLLHLLLLLLLGTGGAALCLLSGAAAAARLAGRELRIPAQLLHQLLAILRVHQLVDTLVTNVRLVWAQRRECMWLVRVLACPTPLGRHVITACDKIYDT